MNSEDVRTGYREVVKLAGLRVQPRYLIYRPVVGNPYVPLFVGNRTPGKFASHLVFDVNDIHGVVAERLRNFFVSWQFRRRFWEVRIFSKYAIQIGRNVGSFAVIDSDSHRGPHILDTVSPAGFVANRRRDSSLNSVAGGAGSSWLSGLRRKERSFAFSLRQQLIGLIQRNVGPVYLSLPQLKFERDFLIGGQANTRARLSLVADGPDAYLILPGRQVRNPVLAVFARQHIDRYLCLCIPGLDKCSLERRAVGTLDCACDLRPITK